MAASSSPVGGPRRGYLRPLRERAAPPCIQPHDHGFVNNTVSHLSMYDERLGELISSDLPNFSLETDR